MINNFFIKINNNSNKFEFCIDKKIIRRLKLKNEKNNEFNKDNFPFSFLSHLF